MARIDEAIEPDRQGSPEHFALRSLLSTSPVPMWVYDLETLRFLAVNEAALERYGYGEDAVLAMRVTDIRPFEDAARLRSPVDAAASSAQRSGPWRHITASGEVIWVDIASRLVDWPGHHAAVVIASELPEHRTVVPAGAPSLPVLSHEAAFTRVVAERLDHARAIGATTAVVVVELGDIGYASASASGPALLDDAVDRIVVACAATDTLGVLSGTRVAALWLSPTRQQVTDKAHRIEAALRDPLLGRRQELLEYRASLGVRIVEPADTHVDAAGVLHDAQLAVGEALRERHSPVVVFEPRLHERLAGQAARDHAMMRALRAEQFVLHYQPIVDLRTMALSGYEALLRWPRPDGVLEDPVEVVALAERTGAIAELGAFVRRQAMGECASLLAANPDLVLSVNLSPHELSGTELVAEVEKLCSLAGVSPVQLCFELTESALVTASEDFWGFSRLHELRGLGATIAIDDFGTGYSALSYLKRLPVDVVKIDRSFVCDLSTSRADTVLVEAITRLAQALGLSVVAEGVENGAELSVLKALGVDRAQGFLLGRPAPIGQFLHESRSQ